MKKVQVLSIFLVMFMVLGILSSNVFAAEAPEQMNLNIQAERPYSGDDSIYEALDIADGASGYKEIIFKIGEIRNSSINFDKNLYCGRRGLAFGGLTEIPQDPTQAPAQYSKVANLKTQANTAINYYSNNIGFTTIDNKLTEVSPDNATAYNAILWLVDNMYIHKDNAAENTANMAALLTKAGITNSKLTEDDIDVIEQYALWYFTNYDQYKDKDFENQYANIYGIFDIDADIDLIDEDRISQMETLLVYLVNSAKANAANYGTGNTRPSGSITTPTVTLTNNNATVNLQQFPLGNYFVVGPFKLTESNNNDNVWNIEVQPTISINGSSYNGTPTYFRSDENNSYTTIPAADLLGETFYVGIPKTDDLNNITDFGLTVSYTYSRVDRQGYLYKNETDNTEQQPVIYVTEETISGSDTTSVTLDNRQFDLSLRKYITAVNGEELTGRNSRVPQINTEPLQNNSDTTAIYVHTKNSLRVTTGDKVTYTLAVYNEGNIKGRVNKIVDYIPEGLTFKAEDNPAFIGVKATYSSQEMETYDYKYEIVNNKLFIEPMDENAWELEAFDGGDTLDSKTISIVFEVTELQGQQRKTMTNIAEIYDQEITEAGLTVSETDSTPNNFDFVEAGDLNTYNGTSQEGGYYAGQEDDDDFERIHLLGISNFDLSLRKYITEINGTELSESRVPQIDTEALNTNSSANHGITTATYVHPKAPVIVKHGDIITYTISVYNEGTVKGKATQITDYIPQGLRFIEIVSGDYEVDNYNQTTNVLVLSEKSSNRYLNAYVSNNNNTIDQTDIVIQCEVTATGGLRDKVLTNVATISGHEVENATGVPDRDSSPEEFELPKNLPGYWGTSGSNPSNGYFEGMEDDDDFEKVVIKGVNFDLSLRKYITAVDGEPLSESRIPQIDTTLLRTNRDTTATYVHPKAPVIVTKGAKVTYTLAVYNEGDIKGRVDKIVDYIPEGLTFNEEDNPEFIPVKDEEYTEQEKAGKKYKYEILGNKLYIQPLDEKEWELEAFDGGNTLDSKTVSLVFEVTANQGDNDKIMTNIAEIASYTILEEVDPTITDRDSDEDNFNFNIIPSLDVYYGKEEVTGYFAGQQDDDDFEKIKLEGVYFDLSLRKFISSVQRENKDGQLVEVMSEEAILDRVPRVNTRPLATGTTASYSHAKDPVVVKKGDIVTFTLRVYNEGKTDGYAETVIDHIPEGLEFVNEGQNINEYRWSYVDSTLNAIKTDYLSKDRTEDNLLPGYTGQGEPSYKDIKVQFKVVAENTYKDNIVNIAEIGKSVAVDENGNELVLIHDRDNENPVDLDNYEIKPAPQNSTYQEDDDDYDQIQLRFFDLSLEKFITAVGENQITDRIPTPRYDDQGNLIYVAEDVEPVEVANTDLVTYTIRIYNEGTIAGYAEEIADDIPQGLVYVPENETNIEYGWVMYYRDDAGNLVQTDDITRATEIRTTYLSEANGEAMMTEEDIVNPNLLNAFDADAPLSDANPDHRDVKVVFKVDESAIPDDNSDRVIINHAQITEDSDDDVDSTPDEWIDDEDDQDIEKVYVKYFDLSLLKWVTKTIVTLNGKTTVTETGFLPNAGLTDQTGDGIRDNDQNEPIAQVVVKQSDLNRVIIKFAYTIRVTNEGDLPGYATEITDYIPEGLRFEQEDNPLWQQVGNTITTHALETRLLQPGESAELEVIFTWINGANNFGVKTNIAEITGDYNDYGDTDDIDSKPGNVETADYNKEQQDDDDFALVVLTVKTGGEKMYIALAVSVLCIISMGVVLIKKYVLA